MERGQIETELGVKSKGENWRVVRAGERTVEQSRRYRRGDWMGVGEGGINQEAATGPGNRLMTNGDTRPRRSTLRYTVHHVAQRQSHQETRQRDY